MKTIRRYFAFCVMLVLLSVATVVFSQEKFWQPTTGPLSQSSVWALAIHPNGDVFAGTYNNGLYRSSDNGVSWIKTNLTSQWIRTLLITSQGHIFAGTYQQGIFRSLDLGHTWQHTSAGLEDSTINVIVVDFSGTLLAGTNRGLFRSLDNGESWINIYPNFTVLTVMPISPRKVFAGTACWGLRQSLDNGENWNILNIGLRRDMAFICYNDILCLIKNSIGHYFVGVIEEGVFRSLNEGHTWQKANNGLAAGPVSAFVKDEFDHIFAATGGGVYLTYDSGDHWVRLNEGLTNTFVRSLAASPENYIFAGTQNGLFRSVVPTNIKTFVEEANTDIPTTFTLEQNYPNPFSSLAASRFTGNPTTTIAFSLPRPEHVTLKIYNTLGEEVATVLQETRNSGTHRVPWQPENLPSGVYLYRLQAGNFAQTKKLLFVK